MLQAAVFTCFFLLLPLLLPGKPSFECDRVCCCRRAVPRSRVPVGFRA